jgi:hypothetical protein
MRAWLKVVITAATALALVATITIGSLLGLNAECNGASDECPRSTAYVGTRLTLPPAALVLLITGAVWSVRRRTLRPLVFAEAAVLAVIATVGAISDRHLALSTIVLLLVAIAVGRAALRAW